ncbi:uncharacterized protein TM35_000033240 [Trypanosoma theileri]|uniref:Uncharacterized protein n=1 Tax=Trypanosoma theileri TaxID=67003 RepID=A0A1X0P6W8_9TRYP|nr:uncharacterized protein TM35_000033240 [Trypanosoma theileri]ORC92571.1 hypothetical protein TM35_000033240 [Trypanosoma theileri]
MRYWGENKKANIKSSSTTLSQFLDEELEEADRLIGPSNMNDRGPLGPEYYCRTPTRRVLKSQQQQQRQEQEQESTLCREAVLMTELQEAKDIIHNLISDRDAIITQFREVQHGLLQQNSAINSTGSELQVLRQKLEDRETTISILERRLKEADSERQSLQEIKYKYEQGQMNERQLHDRIMKLECDVETERIKKEIIMSQLEESKQRILEEGTRWRERCQNAEDRIRVLVELQQQQQQQQQQSLMLLTSSRCGGDKEQRDESTISLDRNEYTSLVKKNSELEMRLQLQCDNGSQDGQLAWKTIQEELKQTRIIYHKVNTEKQKLQIHLEKMQSDLLEQQEKRTLAEIELRTAREKIEELEDLLERLAKQSDKLREENEQLRESTRSHVHPENMVSQTHIEGGEVMEAQLNALGNNLETEKTPLQKEDRSGNKNKEECRQDSLQASETIILLERALHESLMQRERYEAVVEIDMERLQRQLEAAENALKKEIRSRERVQEQYMEECEKVLLLTTELRSLASELVRLEKKVQEVTLSRGPTS